MTCLKKLTWKAGVARHSCAGGNPHFAILGSCPRINSSDGSILVRVTGLGRSAGTNGEHVVDEPLLSDLVHLGVAHDACGLEHLVRGLEDALEV